MDILDLLRSDGSIVINKKLAHKIGLNETILYSELVSKYKYWSDRNKLVDGEFFFCTIEDLQESTTIKKDTQNKALKKLENLGLIEMKRMGLPAKRYFRITDGIINLIETKISQKPKTDDSKVLEGENDDEARGYQISQKPKTRGSKLRNLDEAKTEGNNTISNNTHLIIEEEEEEDKGNSDLIEFLKTKDIKVENAIRFENRLLEKKITGFTMDDVLEAFVLSFTDFKNGVCNDPYLWAVGKLERLLDSKKHAKKGNPRKSFKTPKVPNDIVPDWFEEGKHLIKAPATKVNGEMTEEQKKLEEMMKKYRESN